MIRKFNDEEMLTAQQVAERLNMNPKSIHYYRKKGMLQAYKVKFNRYLFCGEDLNKLLNREHEKAVMALRWAYEDSVSNKNPCQNDNDRIKE
jgi:predicted site-specific integrase-resolvase